MDYSEKEDQKTPVTLKQSGGGLHSRLKTRKLLGVGETDDGDVHRSKLSQILGHSEQLYTKLPRGLRLWQFILALMFTSTSVWAILLPQSLYEFTLRQESEDVVILPVRLYGTALLGFSLVFWGTLKVFDKELIRWALLSSIVYFLAHTIVTLLARGELVTFGSHLAIHHFLFASLSSYFYWAVGEHKLHHVRHSSSSQDDN